MIEALVESRKALDNVNLDSARSYTEDNIGFRNFGEWANAACKTHDPDKIRNILYFGFQPLFDALISDSDLDGQRSQAVNALDELVALSKHFLTSYYQGEPDLDYFKATIPDVAGEMEKVPAQFATKFRNVDYNEIFPRNILQFLKNLLDHVIIGRFKSPEYIIGCACGSSEIALPLAGILGTEVDFIRRSFRRGDTSPRIIEEHDNRLRANIRGKRVLCVDDYTCTTESLYRIMQRARDCKPQIVRGASVRYGHEGIYAKPIHKSSEFYLFKVEGAR